MSRGSLLRLNARTRKSITLSWVVLFVLSLLLQYAQLATPKSTLAVHDLGLFELDGNAVNQAAAGDDWDATPGAQSTQFIHDLTDSQNDDSFTGGSTKDDLPLTGWLWKQAKASQAKNDIADAFAAAYTDNNGDTVAYFGLDKIEADGNNFVGFWFFKNQVGKSGSGAAPGSHFSGNHTVGDILVLANYTNGGSVAGFDVFKWVGSGGNVNGTLQTVENGGECGAEANDDACGKTNANLENSPWPFQGRDTAANKFGPGTFFEGGINLSALELDTGCFTTFLAETRSSQSVDATLSDFALGEFSFCETPNLVTAASDQSFTIGGSVLDTATLTDTKGIVTGTIEFFVCGPSASNPDCDGATAQTTGTKVGATKTLSNGAATSDAFTPDAVGHYCFRAEYTPAAGSHYLATSHTNLTTECFNVTKKQPAISTTASGAVQIGATINDVAHLTGGFSPTGTITFNLYGPNDATCATAIFSSTVSVSGNGNYTSGNYTTTAAGTFRWIASYSGDANNLAVSGSCNDADEDVVVGKLNPDISTTASADVTIGGSVHDVATLSGATANATGTITFNLYGPNDATCDGTAVFTTTALVSGNGAYTSASFAPIAIGTYRWIASYSGDANNEAVSGECNDANESVDVNMASPSITTTASADIKLGGALTDTAHLTGGFNPTGTITFNLYGPNNATCAGAAVFTSTVDVSGNGNYTSGSFTPSAIGIYRWIASYSGDLNNSPVSGACNDENETVSVSTPHIQAEKTVDGVHASQAEPGDVLTFTITVTNTGDADGDASVSDDISAILARSTFGSADNGGTLNGTVLSWPTFTLAANGGTKTLTFTVTLDENGWPVGETVLPNTVVVIGVGSNCPAGEGDADCDTTTTVNQPELTIVKDVSGNTGGTDPILGVPSAKVGDTLLYTLTWTLTSGPVHNAIITDKLPAGMTAPTNVSNGGVYDAPSNTITWHLGTLVDPTGSVTYHVMVKAADAALPQPLVNVATIDSDETEPDSDDASVAVPGQVEAA